MSNTSEKRDGFTIIEVLVVLVIITILAGIVSVNLLSKPGEARVAATKIQIGQLKTALQIYRTEQGRYPTENQGLEALVSKPTIEPVSKNYPSEGYLDSRTVPADPWDNDYIYLSPGTHNEPFELISYGRDGEPGGDEEDADLSSSGM